MPPYPPLETLGNRIVILGPSNAGKSTLAQAIAHKRGLTPIYLDLLRFRPHTKWVARSWEKFVTLHDTAIAEDNWVMEGNYETVFPERFARATAIIALSGNRWLRFWRYVGRTVSATPRIGNLEGNRDTLTWNMTHWVLIESPRHTKRYINMASETGLPLITCLSARDLNVPYRSWGLSKD